MPELGWEHGYLIAIAMMGVVCASLFWLFKRRDWL
jgi:magnesium transporter